MLTDKQSRTRAKLLSRGGIWLAACWLASCSSAPSDEPTEPTRGAAVPIAQEIPTGAGQPAVAATGAISDPPAAMPPAAPGESTPEVPVTPPTAPGESTPEVPVTAPPEPTPPEPAVADPEPPPPDFSMVLPEVPAAPAPAPPTVLPTFPVPPPTPQANPDADRPSDVLNLSRWRLELPTGRDGNIDRVAPDDLDDDFSVSPFFRVNPDRTAVVFRAHAGGATTGNSGFPRTELREMKSDDDEADWSVNSKRTMTIVQRVVNLPRVKPHVVVGQIHDDEDDVVMVRLEGVHLFVESRSQDLGTLTNTYRLGDWFKIRIIVDDGDISVEYNENKVVKMPSNLAKCDGGCYFKAGCYTQSNDSIDDSDEYAEVHISDLSVSSN